MLLRLSYSNANTSHAITSLDRYVLQTQYPRVQIRPICMISKSTGMLFMVPGCPLGFMLYVSDRVRFPHADEDIKESEGDDDGSPPATKSRIHWLASGSLG